MGYADDETRGIPRAMHANGFSRPTRREARLREERGELFWFASSTWTVMVGQIVDRIAQTRVGGRSRVNEVGKE